MVNRNPSKCHSAFALHRIADDRKGFLTAFVVRNDVVRALVIALVDLILGHELIDDDRPSALDFNRLKFVRPNLNIAPTFEFVTFQFSD